MNTIRTANLYDYVLLILLSAIWGSAFVAIEVAVDTYPPMLVAFGRILLAFLFLYIIMKIQNKLFPSDFKTWKFLILAEILNSDMPFFLISWAQQYVNASTAAIMMAAGPFFALILSHFVTNDEKFTITKLIGVVLGFIGIFVLLGDEFLNGKVDSLYGQLALLLSVAGYISSGLVIRKISYVPTIVSSTSLFLVSSVALLPFVLFLDFSTLPILDMAIFPIIYLAILPTAVASLMQVQIVKKVGVSFMSQVAYLIPIFAIIWSWIIFDVTPKQSAWIALLLVLGGLFVRNLKLKK
jgi:drug/metabolite transporter (DMT)-like permease